MTTALVPVRLEPVAKRRLAHIVGAEERRAIVRGWFDHVVDVLDDAGLEVIVLASNDIDTEHEVWRDRGAGLERAVADGIERAGLPALVVHADLPALTTADIDALIDREGELVLGRSRDGGTNAAMVRRPFALRFGERSALRNAHRARAAGLRAVVLDRPGLALDVDDEAALVASGVSAASQPSSSRTSSQPTSWPRP